MQREEVAPDNWSLNAQQTVCLFYQWSVTEPQLEVGLGPAWLRSRGLPILFPLTSCATESDHAGMLVHSAEAVQPWFGELQNAVNGSKEGKRESLLIILTKIRQLQTAAGQCTHSCIVVRLRSQNRSLGSVRARRGGVATAHMIPLDATGSHVHALPLPSVNTFLLSP